MKKTLALLGVIILITACGEKEDKTLEIQENELVEIKPEFDITYDNSIHTYNVQNSTTECESQDEAICAVDLTVKCTINSKMDKCYKAKMPKFIFMEDESLMRPSEISFKIHDIKTIDANNIEIHTISECDGNWFGLCKGNVIYVLSNKTGNWYVKDIYALENM